jgi:hypothetical protein
MERFRFYAGVFIVTAATLTLQLVETRILSVIAWYHLAFFVISTAMFGLTAGAVWVYLKGDKFTEGSLSHDLAYYSAAFAVGTCFSLAAQLTIVAAEAFSVTSLVAWTELAICIALPFFFSGVVVSLALTRSPYPIGRVYGVDLLGAAIGCLGVLLLLNSTDAPSAVLWVATAAAAAAIAFRGSGIGGVPEKVPAPARILGRPGIIFVVLLIAAIANGMTRHGLQPLLAKGQLERRGPGLAFEAWNSFSRIIATASRKGPPHLWGPSPTRPLDQVVESRRMNIDGAAATWMFRFGGQTEEVEFLKYDVTNLSYFLPDREKAAVIGVGGGCDVLSAWMFGLRDITGVEINPIFIELLTTEPGFVDFAGIGKLDGVDLVIDEARSWFARTEETFDVIQMSMIDTFAATGAGAFTLTENGLYTEESWEIFLRRLTPNGVFTVSRWHAPTEIDETGRMVSLAVAALLNRGVADPTQHIFLASAGNIATLVLSVSPFSDAYLEALEDAAAHYEYRVLIGPHSEPASEVLRNIMEAVGPSGREGLIRYTSSLVLDLTPPTDDRPFFFNQLRFQKPLDAIKLIMTGAAGAHLGVVGGNLIAALTLVTILAISVVLVLATIVVPLRSAIRDVGTTLATAGTAYFLLIGVGFMAVEIGLLQRLSVFLGHPIYSLSVVLFSLILAMGIGSLASDRWLLNSRAKFAIWALLIGGYIATMPLWLSSVLHDFSSAGLFLRGSLSILVIVPVGFLMGFGFPTGMRLISAFDRKPTPWFWGINGAAGVLASGMSVATSIAFGISATLCIGAVCYLLLIPSAFAIGFGTRTVPDQLK